MKDVLLVTFVLRIFQLLELAFMLSFSASLIAMVDADYRDSGQAFVSTVALVAVYSMHRWLYTRAELL